jgi:alpha-L-fucosidase
MASSLRAAPAEIVSPKRSIVCKLIVKKACNQSSTVNKVRLQSFEVKKVLNQSSVVEKVHYQSSNVKNILYQISEEPIPPRLEWFANAKLGIFIHWGIYAVDGTSESWSFHNRTTPYSEYMSQLLRFGAQNYNPAQWAELIKNSGAQYAVITLQHHDGVALYNTAQITPATDLPTSSNPSTLTPDPKFKLWNPKLPLSTLHQSPAKRDLIQPLAQELRNQNIKFGAYYSLLDWSHPHYPGFFKDQSRYTLSEDTVRWQKYLSFMHAQINEINQMYQPDLFWFDGDWEHSLKEWNAQKIHDDIRKTNPNAIINGRLKELGDYATPEQNMPITPPVTMPWELCMTTNDNWGYRPHDTAWKSSNHIIRIFADVLGMGGNLLLDIGPKADGTIPKEQEQILKDLGRWVQKHQEAIYSSRAGLPHGHFQGPSTLTQDSQTLYLFLTQVQGVPMDGKYIADDELVDAINEALVKVNEEPITFEPTDQPKYSVMLKGLSNEILSAEVLGSDTKLQPNVVGKISWSSVPGTVFIDVPYDALDEQVTVLKLTLKGALSLYRGQGGFH